MSNRALTVSIVGATGMVGRELLDVLEKRRFPTGKLYCFSSGESRKSVRFRGKALPAPGIDRKALESSDLVFFVSADEVSARFAQGLAAKGVWVIDDSSAFRLDPKVPLVIPEVNARDLSPQKRLIAGPNCTMTGLAVAAYGLHKNAKVTAVRMASYQAVSGAGKAAVQEFLSQNRGEKTRPRALPRPIAFNVFPQVGGFDAAGNSSEENKVAAELRKIWGAPRLKVSATAVRVPVLRGHSLAAWVTLARALSPEKARKIMRVTEGLELSPGLNYPTPLSCANRWPVFAGRVRAGTHSKELALWIVSDNLLKGAALNSVQIAEYLLHRGWLKKR